MTTEYVNIMEAARRCGVSDKTIRRAIHKGTLPARFPQFNRCEIALIKRGEWTDAEGTVVMLAFDAKGRKAFYQLYRDLPHFTRCSQCPHGYLDTV